MRWRSWHREPRPSPGEDAGGGRPRRGTRSSERRLVEECEAFVTGRLAEHLEARGGDVPVWAWTNLLAHGTDEDLGDERLDAHPAGLFGDEEWYAARSYLATELVNVTELVGTAGEGQALAEVQHLVLVPLELRLAATPEAEAWSVQHWVATVKAAIDEHARARRRARAGAGLAPPLPQRAERTVLGIETSTSGRAPHVAGRAPHEAGRAHHQAGGAHHPPG